MGVIRISYKSFDSFICKGIESCRNKLPKALIRSLLSLFLSKWQPKSLCLVFKSESNLTQPICNFKKKKYFFIETVLNYPEKNMLVKLTCQNKITIKNVNGVKYRK